MPASIKRYLVLFALVLVATGLYTSRSQTLVVNTSQTATFTNPYLLKDWAPDNVYNAALQHVGYYLATNSIQGKQLTITDTPRYTSDGSLSFEFYTDQDSNLHTVTVETTDYGGGVSSSLVSVDGNVAAYAPANQLYSATFAGFDSLTNYGLSAMQIYEMQSALTRFSESGQFDINTNSISQSAATLTATTMNLTVNDRSYRLTAYSSEINAIRFVLFDSNNKQVFDSGNVVLSN